jgi:hypothetical protein
MLFHNFNNPKASTVYPGEGSRLLDRAGGQGSLGGAGTHHCTILWMPVITQLWMNLNRVKIGFHE